MKKNKNGFSLGYIIILLFLASIFIPSCTEDTSLEKKEFNDMVDTLYSYQIKEFNRALDSICEAQKDSVIQYNVDSIMKIRLEQIEKLIEK